MNKWLNWKHICSRLKAWWLRMDLTSIWLRQIWMPPRCINSSSVNGSMRGNIPNISSNMHFAQPRLACIVTHAKWQKHKHCIQSLAVSHDAHTFIRFGIVRFDGGLTLGKEERGTIHRRLCFWDDILAAPPMMWAFVPRRHMFWVRNLCDLHSVVIKGMLRGC